MKFKIDTDNGEQEIEGGAKLKWRKAMNFGRAIQYMKQGDNVTRLGWLASQSDMLADDWVVV